MLKLFIFCCCVLEVYAVKAEFEQFYQTSGEEYINFNLRVRKFNRTTSVLNGTAHVLLNVNNSLTFTMDMFHSPLGNQQFNHNPMKIPTAGACTFVDHLYQLYPMLASMITNLPDSGECPISIRQMYVLDQQLPSKVALDIARNGLWKVVITGLLKDVKVFEFYVFVKINGQSCSCAGGVPVPLALIVILISRLLN